MAGERHERAVCHHTRDKARGIEEEYRRSAFADSKRLSAGEPRIGIGVPILRRGNKSAGGDVRSEAANLTRVKQQDEKWRHRTW